MSNILNEELGRMKSLFSYQKGRVISEQSNKYSSPEEEIIYTLARAVGGPGTNIERLKQAFGLFKSGAQLSAVEKMMNEKPIYGYKTIAGLLQGELEQDNQKDFVELQKLVAPKGITLAATTQKSASGLPFLNLNTIKVTYGNPTTPAPQNTTTSGTTTASGSTVTKKVAPKKVAPPKEMGSITAFQDWLDTKHAGWATGYKGGIISKGQNGGGYGSYGPRTQKAWKDYGQEYLTKDVGALANKGKEAADQEINQQFNQNTETQNTGYQFT
jgi:hypothetical protein